MRISAVYLVAACAALMVPGAATGQSLFAELGLDDLDVAAPASSTDDPVEMAQVGRKNGTWNQPMVNTPASASVEGVEEPDASAGTSDLDRQVMNSSFSSLFSTSSLPYEFRRQTVRYDGDYAPGTIVIDTKTRHLYHVQPGGYATRYGVGVGRAGFAWKGSAYIGLKREWPDWHPPATMRAREPWLPVRMEGGPENPLGARAMYLYRDGNDTLYRIHGTNQPTTIGQAVSSGCIRMLNEDVIYLYDHVKTGTKVVVI